MEGQHYNGDSSSSYVNNMLGDQAVIQDAAIDPVEFLSLQFPGFSAESLADIYFANGYDLNATIEMLSQLEVSFCHCELFYFWSCKGLGPGDMYIWKFKAST